MELGAIQKGPVKCYFCGKQGHIKKKCFKFIKKQEQDKAKKAGNNNEQKNWLRHSHVVTLWVTSNYSTRFRYRSV